MHSADGLQTAGLVMQPFLTVAEDVFMSLQKVLNPYVVEISIAMLDICLI